MSKNFQYITDAEGHRTAVIVPIDEFEEMLEDLHIGRVARESENEPRRPFMELVEEMRKAGEIDVLLPAQRRRSSVSIDKSKTVS